MTPNSQGPITTHVSPAPHRAMGSALAGPTTSEARQPSTSRGSAAFLTRWTRSRVTSRTTPTNSVTTTDSETHSHAAVRSHAQADVSAWLRLGLGSDFNDAETALLHAHRTLCRGVLHDCLSESACLVERLKNDEGDALARVVDVVRPIAPNEARVLLDPFHKPRKGTQLVFPHRGIHRPGPSNGEHGAPFTSR